MPKFHYVLLTMPGDQEAYEALRQRALDDPEDVKILGESDHWTRGGEHLIAVRYLIAGDEAY